MSEPEEFLARWSRRKREADEAKPAACSARGSRRRDDSASRRCDRTRAPGERRGAEPAFDPREPAADRIRSRPHRHPRVPCTGRAGRSDPCGASPRVDQPIPAIRDFVGLAENALGLHRARRDAGLRPARADRRTARSGGADRRDDWREERSSDGRNQRARRKSTRQSRDDLELPKPTSTRQRSDETADGRWNDR